MLGQSKPIPVMYIKKAFLENLGQGSHEVHVKRVIDLAAANLSKIVGENIKTNIYPLCTFKKHAIVADDFSNLYRIEFDGSKDLELLKVEKVEDVKKYSAEDIEKELGSDCTESLVNAIAKPQGEWDNKLKEAFVNLLNFKTNGMREGYTSLKQNLN
jgi:hypothetical protein